MGRHRSNSMLEWGCDLVANAATTKEDEEVEEEASRMLNRADRVVSQTGTFRDAGVEGQPPAPEPSLPLPLIPPGPSTSITRRK